MGPSYLAWRSGGSQAMLEVYSNSNWICDIDEIYTTAGYVFTLRGDSVSTMEAKLTALDTAFAEAKWLRELLLDLPVVEKQISAIIMNCNNQMVITKVYNAKDNAKSIRHVKSRLKSVRKLRNSRVIAVAYVQIDKNLTNPFTKGLLRNVIENASRGI